MNVTKGPGSEPAPHYARRRFPRGAFIGAAAALAISTVLVIGLVQPAVASATPSTPTGPGSVSGAPNLSPGFTDTLTSRYVDIGGLRLHAVIGSDGQPQLLDDNGET
jgi:hypothetical protein